MFIKFRNGILGISEEDYRQYKDDYYKAKENKKSDASSSG